MALALAAPSITHAQTDAGTAADAVEAPAIGDGGAAAGTSSDADAGYQVPSYLPPESPALTLLGAATTTVDQPGNPAAFGAALANLITPQGTVRSGVTIEISTRAFGITNLWNAHQYANSWWRQFVSRISLSLATTSETAAMGTTPTVRLAFGLRLVFLNEADPFLNATYRRTAGERLRTTEAYDRCRRAHPTTVDTDCATEVADRIDAASVTDVATLAAPWNAGGLALATASSFRFEQARLSNADDDLFSTWLTGALRLWRWGQIAGAVTWRHDFASHDNELALAARLRIGTSDFRGTVEGAWSPVHADNATSYGRLSVGTEVRLSSQTWLSASIGGDFGPDTSPGSLFVLSNLKINLPGQPGFSTTN